MLQEFHGVILDVDGTLIDSNDAHARAWVDAFARHGITVSFDKVRRSIGMGGDKLVPTVAGLREDEGVGKKVSQERGEIFRSKYLPQLQAFPKTRELLQRIHELGLRMAVASSAKKEELHKLLDICGVADLIESKTSSDDAENSKPDPDIVEAAVEKLGLPPAETVMLGDTPYDVQAAQQAGVPIIAFRCGGWQDADLHGAIAVFDGPADLLAKLDAVSLTR